MGSGNWLSKTKPSFAPVPQSAKMPTTGTAPEYGDDVIRRPGSGPGQFEGLEYWTTDVTFDVGRDFEGIKYLYTPGQTVHDGGRDPRKGQIVSEWFGTGWEDRALAFLQMAETVSVEGTLLLPRPWGSITARVGPAHVQHDPLMAGCTITFDWQEAGHIAGSYIDATRPPTTAEVLAGVPDDAADLREAAEAYLSGVEDADTTADDLLLLLLEMRTMANAYEVTVDTTTFAGCVYLDGVALAIAGAIRLFPDRLLLEAAWV
jgi:hypothetical protein